MYPAYNYKAPKCFTGMLDAVLAVTAPFERRGTDGKTNQEILKEASKPIGKQSKTEAKADAKAE